MVQAIRSALDMNHSKFAPEAGVSQLAVSAVSSMMLQLMQVWAGGLRLSSASHATAETQPWIFSSLVESAGTTSPLTKWLSH